MAGQSMEEVVSSWQDEHDLDLVRSQVKAKIIKIAQSSAAAIQPDSISPSPYLQDAKEYQVAVEGGIERLPFEVDSEFGDNRLSIDTVGVDNPVARVYLAAVQPLGSLEELIAGHTQPDCPDVTDFELLAMSWKKAHAFSSSATSIATHPDYQEIIAMGMRAVPLILSDLKEKPDHWFIALREITGVNPVPVSAQGRLSEMAQAWIRWGESNRYI